MWWKVKSWQMSIPRIFWSVRIQSGFLTRGLLSFTAQIEYKRVKIFIRPRRKAESKKTRKGSLQLPNWMNFRRFSKWGGGVFWKF